MPQKQSTTDLYIGDNLDVTFRKATELLSMEVTTDVGIYLNQRSSGLISIALNDLDAKAHIARDPSCYPYLFLYLDDLPIINQIIASPFISEVLYDHIIHVKPPIMPLSITAFILEVFPPMLRDALERIDELSQPQTIQESNMALRGPLTKVVNYMAVMFAQHGYEILNIAFNMSSHEYELLTPAEVDRMEKTNKWGDRRKILSCSIHELRNITATPQLTLELVNDTANNAYPGENRELNPHIDSSTLPRENGPSIRRSGYDQSHPGVESNNMEPTDEPPIRD